MKNTMKNILGICFLILFLPYVITLLLSGRQGVGRQEKLPEREYEVLEMMLSEDLSWMDASTLRLLAVLKRTEVVRQQESGVSIVQDLPKLYGGLYSRVYEAVEETEGQVVTINGEFRELPYHGISSGHTRDGKLLGEEYFYIKAVDCPLDSEAEEYLQFFYMDKEEFYKRLGYPELKILPTAERDEADYVNRLILGDAILQGEKARELLHLPSSCFFLEEDGRRIRITVKGSGHGFGISLYTAGRMMEDGADMKEIFQHFYEDAECITLP